LLPDKPAVFDKACVVTRLIAFFQAFYPLTRVIAAFIAVSTTLFPHTILDFTAAAMPRLSQTAAKAAAARFIMGAMLIANLAVHPTGGKHPWFYRFRHFHADNSCIMAYKLEDKLISL